MPAYVPPHRRQAPGGGGVAVASAARPSTHGEAGGPAGPGLRSGRAEPSKAYHYPDLVRYFWPDKEEAVTGGHESMFHDSTSRPGQLAYVTLYTDINPRWEEDQVLYARSNLELLPDYTFQLEGEAEYLPNPMYSIYKPARTPPLIYQPRTLHEPIAVFEVTASEEYTFAGWYSVKEVCVLAPHSFELTFMMQEKWDAINFKEAAKDTVSPSGWIKTLSDQWAIVKFKKLPPLLAPAAPEIEKESKGEAEMLNDLRQEDQMGGDKEQCTSEKKKNQKGKMRSLEYDEYDEYDEDVQSVYWIPVY
ncbi:hypothetical protein PG999_000753 [Apiospora kogelbergensis]|uniref:Uncharacterized protein n=1 Tax=Apiospora kogelbergensis TaxID=1337665 RepID=A0AAW0RCD3_9PEZI